MNEKSILKKIDARLNDARLSLIESKDYFNDNRFQSSEDLAREALDYLIEVLGLFKIYHSGNLEKE